MKEQINNELLKLQEQLGALATATKEISKAGEISETIIENTKNIHDAYKIQLEKIQDLYSEFLNKTYQHTEENIKKIFKHFQEKIKDEEKILEKYTELSIKTEDLTHDYLKNITKENKDLLLELITEAENNLKEHGNLINLYIC